MTVIFAIIFLLSIPAFIFGMIAPKVFSRLFKGDFSRPKIALIVGGTMLASFIGIGATVPPSETVTNNEELSQATDVVADQLDVNPTETVDGIEIVQVEANSEEQNIAQGRTQAKVVRVTDGDTVTVDIDGKNETIRIIGINTPETVDPRKPVECFGKEASDRSHALLEGQVVTLEADVTQGERDKYNRLLRYVFLPDGADFGLKMIQEGLAYEYTYSTPYTYQSAYKDAQSQAEANKRGLWADDACEAFTADNNATTTTSGTTPVVPTQNGENTTPPAITPVVSDSCSCPVVDLDCGDFSTHSQAQAVYECCVATKGYDVHRLDGNDNDGLACESLP
jgi:micrococcal nuclease